MEFITIDSQTCYEDEESILKTKLDRFNCLKSQNIITSTDYCRTNNKSCKK